MFIQWDKQWGYLQYGDDFAGVNGDGPMCLAMAGYHLTKEERFSPDNVIAFSMENSFYNSSKGTLDALMVQGAGMLGLESAELQVNEEALKTAMNEGKVVICLAEKGSISVQQHYIVLRSYEEASLFVNDPTSIVNSEKEWTFEEFLPRIKSAWAISK